MLLFSSPPVYPPERALADAAQVLPILVVAATMLVAVLLDLALPRHRRDPVVAWTAGGGLLAALAASVARLAAGGGGSAYSGYVTGDSFALYFEVLLSLLGALSVGVAHAYVRRRGLPGGELQVLLLAAVVGMMTLAAATSLVTVFLGLETLSIALYIASGYARRDTSSQEAAVKYLLVGGFASAFVLYGMALVYGATGSTKLAEIAQRVTEQDATNPLLIGGVVLLAVGFAFKISGAPFHQWTPDVYQGAPLPVTAFMSVGTKAAAFAMIIRVFNAGLPHLQAEWSLLLAFVALCSMVVGNLAAIAQTSVKRLLAYSGVAQGGYMLLGVIAGSKQGLAAVMFYLFAYLFFNFGSFAVLTALVTPEGERDRLGDLDGLGYRNRLLGVLLTFFMISLAGFPPTVGFIGKLFLFIAAVAAGWTWLVVVAALASVVSFAYYVRVVYHLWTPVAAPRELFRSPAFTAAVAVSAGLSLALILVAASLFGTGLTGAGGVLAAGR